MARHYTIVNNNSTNLASSNRVAFSKVRKNNNKNRQKQTKKDCICNRNFSSNKPNTQNPMGRSLVNLKIEKTRFRNNEIWI